MKLEINTICFIFLFLFLICAASAADPENETISAQQPDPDQALCKTSVKNSEQPAKGSVEVKKETAKEKVTLNAPNLKMYYKDGSKFKVTLKNKNKKAISKGKISIKVNGKTYNKITNSKGIATLNINLKSGKYIVLTKFAGSSKYSGKSLESSITVKSTVKASDFKKYYKNTSPYSSTFYNQKGKILKNSKVKFKLNSKTYPVKTNSKGIAKLSINLKPGKYSISAINSKTSESITKSITVKSLIETKDLKTNESSTGKFNVKILNSNGKGSPNKKVSFKIGEKTYTKTTDKNGIATLNLNLKAGNYNIITEYGGLKNKNRITVTPITASNFTHTTLIPNYVNVTTNYAYPSAYTVKTGPDGIVKLPKNELFTVQIGPNNYKFSTSRIDGIDSTTIGYKSHLIPFDGSAVRSDTNKSKLTDDGIIISMANGLTQIDYQSRTKDNTALFGFYASKGMENSEILTYMENDKITAKIGIQTQSYDETGLRYSIGKFYGKTIYDFNYKSYDEITLHNTEFIKFTNNGKPVTFSYFGNTIVGYSSKEDIITKFKVNGKEELEKMESISYGLSQNYRTAMGFEVLQSYSIINEKITQNILENWLSKNPNYLNRFGVMNIYGMHLASLETVWLADVLADSHSKEFNVKWERSHTLTVLGGINLEDTYLNILNSDMGMEVTGNSKNVILFRLLNSINLPHLEDYAFTTVSERFLDKSVNSLDEVFAAISKNSYSMAQLGDLLYIFAQDNASAIILNCTSGVSSVVLAQKDSIYKGSVISTTKDCCGVGIMPKDIIKGIRDAISIMSPGVYKLTDKLNEIHPFNVLLYKGLTFLLGKTLDGASLASLGLFTTMALVQSGGTIYRDGMVNEKDWYGLMDKVTFTRPGYLQSKKLYNIPNKNGGYDFVEVKIKNDLTLDRDSAIYISDGKTKQLTKAETYKYFCEDYWTPFSMPAKYWDKSWSEIK